MPGDAATIQAGIDSAAAGDTVLVAPGTYSENVIMKSGVVLRSEAGAGSTTIDGGGIDAVVTFDGASETGIEGFALRHGNGPAPGGGGVRAINSAGFIRANVVAENRSAQFGGGNCLSGSTFAIEFNNEVAYDSATSHGGGIALVNVSRTRPSSGTPSTSTPT